MRFSYLLVASLAVLVDASPAADDRYGAMTRPSYGGQVIHGL